ncbi:MAG: hypothetical protein ABS934_00135, partial [Psychrobacillus sp.]
MKKIVSGTLCSLGLLVLVSGSTFNLAVNDKPEITSVRDLLAVNDKPEITSVRDLLAVNDKPEITSVRDLLAVND